MARRYCNVRGLAPAPGLVVREFNLNRASPRPVIFIVPRAVTSLLLFAVVAASGATRNSPAPTYEKDIRPILKANCFPCHGEGEQLKGGLDLRLRHLIATGGESGAAIVAGKPEKSLFFTKIRDGEMPKSEKKLTKAEIETIRQWIAAGAKTARPEPKELGKEPYFTEDERSYWFFQPVRRPEVPKVRYEKLVRNPVDAFLLKQIEAQKLSFNPEADRRTLIRRATFDLTGLPPTPEEVQAFLENQSSNAYEQLIDRLLASPRYGERWGRHWLDVAGYADSDGYNEADTERKYS